MCKGTGKYVGAAATYAACGEADVPDWAKKCYNETNEKILAVLKDPMIIGETIAQGASDGLDQKGTPYCAGYVGGVAATSVATDKGLSKLGEMAKGTKFLGKTDDMAKAAAEADDMVMDSLNNVANASKKSPDVIVKVSESGRYSNASFASEDKLVSHFEKHGAEFKGIYNSADEYLQGARDVMNNGYKVEYSYKGETRVGYVQYMENNSKGKAKFAFVGTNNEGYITTFHTESGKTFWKLLNGKNIPVINPK